MAERPNIVFIMCDQLRWCEVGCYGNPSIRTPNIDRLAAGGVRFETGCTNSPLCAPSRSVTISGQYCRTCRGRLGGLGDSTRPRTEFGDPTLAELLREVGYQTAVIGSWNVQPKPDLLGFDYAAFPDNAAHYYYGRNYFINSDQKQKVDGWTWDFETTLAGEYLKNVGSKPFFLYFNLEPPHMPLMSAPDEGRNRYIRSDVVMRPNALVDGKLPFDDEWFKIYLWEQNRARAGEPDSRPVVPEGFDLIDLMVLYYGMVDIVDRQVGKLMDALVESGHDRDTIVVFVSDHGDNLGSHHWFNKMRPTDESIRIPMIVRDGRSNRAGSVATQVASLVDMTPTLLGMAGLDIPAHLAGTDLSPVIRGEKETVGENSVYVECINGVENDELVSVIAIRTQDHMLGMRLAGCSAYEHDPSMDAIADKGHCFYDLRTDPYQMLNLAKTDEQAAVAEDPRRRLRQWHESTPWLT